MTNQDNGTVEQTIAKNSKITAEDVIRMRTLKFENPDLSVQEIKDKLEIPLSVMAIGRCLRGIYHSDVDMCGLEVKAFTHKPQIAARLERKAARKAERKVASAEKKAAKAAAKEAKQAEKPVEVSTEVAKNAKGGLEFTEAQIELVKKLAGEGKKREEIAKTFNVSLASVARILQGKITATR